MSTHSCSCVFDIVVLLRGIILMFSQTLLYVKESGAATNLEFEKRSRSCSSSCCQEGVCSIFIAIFLWLGGLAESSAMSIDVQR